ncbi:MAG: hypothetical protein IT182_18370 [Acidobacteria bacterium]|nr:hypothetical protein [Acidobacteriota bacterium]
MRQGHASKATPNRAVLVALLCGVSVVGCTRSKPVAAPRVVALEMPPPPARVISVPPEPVLPTEATTVERPAPANRPTRAARSTQGRTEPPKQAEAPSPAAPVETPLTAPEHMPAPGPLLRTPQTADEANAERRTREVLGRATGLLDRVNAARLGQQARQQHETARRFVDQSLQALSERNYLLAASLADKAETLARGLSR